MRDLNRREAMLAASAGYLSMVSPRGRVDDNAMEPGNKETIMAEPDAKTLQEMASRARTVSSAAYCPYSKFRVGAVALTTDGQMFEGCNVENASYGLTICAERNAVFQMVSKAKQQLAALVIYTPTPKPSAPCGACRQVLNEFGPDALIISTCDGPDVLKKKLSELLPDAFGPANLQ